MDPFSPFSDRSSQIAGYLRTQIRKGQWRDYFPSERVLALQLRVSRRSIAAALIELTEEGLLENLGRVGRRIVRSRSKRKNSSIQRSIGLLVAASGRSIRGNALYLVDELRKSLEVHEIKVEMHRMTYPPRDHAPVRFKKLILTTHHDGWILFSPTESMQYWCKSHGISAMTFGMGGSNLPSVSIDLHAVCRHAVGEALRRGHRHLALISPREERIEEIASREGFLEGLMKSPHRNTSHVLEYHDTTIQGVCNMVDRLLARSQIPTAWMICRQGHYFTVHTYLQKLGIRLSKDISIICRDSGDHITDLVPEPTRYEQDLKSIAIRCARMTIQTMKKQVQNPCVRVIPEFFAGETLGSL